MAARLTKDLDNPNRVFLIDYRNDLIAAYRADWERCSWRTIDDGMHPEPESAIYVNGAYYTGEYFSRLASGRVTWVQGVTPESRF